MGRSGCGVESSERGDSIDQIRSCCYHSVHQLSNDRLISCAGCLIEDVSHWWIVILFTGSLSGCGDEFEALIERYAQPVASLHAKGFQNILDILALMEPNGAVLPIPFDLDAYKRLCFTQVLHSVLCSFTLETADVAMALWSIVVRRS